MVLNFIKNQNCIYLNEFQKYIKDLLQSAQKSRDNHYTKILHLANLSPISLPREKDEYIISQYKNLNNVLSEIQASNKLHFDNLFQIMHEHLDNINKKLELISCVEMPKNSNISPAIIQEICNDYNNYCNQKFKEAEIEIIKSIQIFVDKVNNLNQDIDDLSRQRYSSQNHELLGNESRFILKDLKIKINNIITCLKNEIDKLSNESEIILEAKQKEQKYANHIHLIQFMDNILHKIANIENECMVFQEILINSSKILKNNMADMVSEITKIRTAVIEAEEIYIG